MLSWGVIAYGAALSAILAVILVLAVRERDPVVLVLVAVGAFAAPIAWNAILRAAHGDQFFTDAPTVVFPISWQDTGSGVFTFALLTILLGLGPRRTAHARRVVVLAGLAAIAALLVDIYLY